MLTKIVFAVMICGAALVQTAFSQTAATVKSRAELIKAAVAGLESNDLQRANQAARELGYLKAVEAVPALLKVLKSARFLAVSEHVLIDEKTKHYEWRSTNVRATIIHSLGLIGDRRAVPVIKKYLIKPPKNQPVPGNYAAYALYLLTGKSYKYKDYDGKIKRFQNREN